MKQKKKKNKKQKKNKNIKIFFIKKFIFLKIRI